MNADRNLLLGLIALQNNFVDRHDLVTAFDRWIGDKSIDLGNRLLQAQVISMDELRIIEALVDRQLRKHDGDAQASLAAFQVVEPFAVDLQKFADQDLQASLGHLPRRPNSIASFPTDSIGTLSLVDSKSGSGRFRILRAHAQGGLGEVFVAEDNELHREVALKRIRDTLADDPQNRFRFVVEAEITGALEHPGIVPVYGLGNFDDGRPYYAMRLIRGQSYKEAIDRYHQARKQSQAGGDSLVLRGLLGRFVDVCDAIEYAHSRGILHRDLKPANIMLGRYGETLVVDWGLARTHETVETESHDFEEAMVRPFSGVEEQATQWGSAIGTPQFMSPEQAAGRLEMLGPGSDVYSLGATLYYLLTGEPPVASETLGELLQKVQQGEIADVRERNPHIDEALSAICHKSMAKQPKDRYFRAVDLANDIQKWLADEPVQALREHWRHRLGRWVRRNHSTVMIAAVTATVLMSILSVSLAFIFAAQRREAQERERAEKSFRAARETVDKYFTQVSEATLLNQPGLQPLRKDLLQDALAYYRDFLIERADDHALQADTMSAAFNLARVHEELGEFEQAANFYQQASVGQHSLLRANPQELKLTEMLSDTLAAQGRLALNHGSAAESLRFNRESQQLRERLVASAPQRWEFQRKLANCLMNEGLCYLRSGKLSRAEDSLRQAQNIRAPWADASGVNAIRRDFAKGHYNLGALLVQRGNSIAAQREFEVAAELAEELVQSNPLDLELKLLISTCYRLIGDSLAGGNEPLNAIPHYERALTSLTSLVHRNPEISEYQLGLAGVYMNLANVYLHGDKVFARQSLNSAITILNEQVKENSGPTARRDLALSLRVRGELVDGTADEEAIRDLEQSVAIFHGLVAEFVDHADYAEELVLSKVTLKERQEQFSRSKFR